MLGANWRSTELDSMWRNEVLSLFVVENFFFHLAFGMMNIEGGDESGEGAVLVGAKWPRTILGSACA